MKAVILAGGFGSRLGEETAIRPKPLVEIGGKPILWHIMKLYSTHGINDFVICLGYKGYMIKEYFANYFLRNADVTFDIEKQSMEVHRSEAEPWRVTLIETGDDSGTGGRLKQALPYVADDPSFCMTYGDGVGDIDLTALLAFHQSHGALATVTATRPLPRFGIMQIEGDRVTDFQEKPHGKADWVNGGFFVLSPAIGDYIDDDSEFWERKPIRRVVADDQLRVFRHDGFWRPMDTIRDKNTLETLWETGDAPWKIW
ncbi:MAG: glucose-1-phosphate cytidylyltransferase [Rhodospirillaceae bacterium]|nr:glucose-1-phosphate cytidylyltransferase [Rhodospirillaceae bacterium]MBT7511978.1 glucose-1-phosphate cytidylyltransferase [Rhodospirillaceae bacterium]